VTPYDVGKNMPYFEAYMKINKEGKIKFCLYSVCIYKYMYEIPCNCHFDAFFKLQNISAHN